MFIRMISIVIILRCQACLGFNMLTFVNEVKLCVDLLLLLSLLLLLLLLIVISYKYT